MAFGDAAQKFWTTDLTTRAGALSATKSGSTGAFIFCGMGVVGMIFFGLKVGFTTSLGIAEIAAAGFEAAVALIAGLRLRQGKGVIWGGAAAVLVALEGLGKVVAMSIGGALLSLAVLIMLINGVRGALALKKDAGFEDDDVEVFN